MTTMRVRGLLLLVTACSGSGAARPAAEPTPTGARPATREALAELIFEAVKANAPDQLAPVMARVSEIRPRCPALFEGWTATDADVAAYHQAGLRACHENIVWADATRVGVWGGYPERGRMPCHDLDQLSSLEIDVRTGGKTLTIRANHVVRLEDGLAPLAIECGWRREDVLEEQYALDMIDVGDHAPPMGDPNAGSEQELRTMTAQVCACKDKTCYDEVMAYWAAKNEDRNRSRFARPSERIKKIAEELGKCVTRIMQDSMDLPVDGEPSEGDQGGVDYQP